MPSRLSVCDSPTVSDGCTIANTDLFQHAGCSFSSSTMHPCSIVGLQHFLVKPRSTKLTTMKQSQKTRDFKINIVDFKINIVVKTHNLSSSIKSNQTQSTPIRPRHSRKTSPSLHSTPLHSTPLHSTSKSEEKPHIAMARDVPENRYEVPNAQSIVINRTKSNPIATSGS